MEFRLLGPFEAIDGGKLLSLGGRKPRALLARLLLDVNRTVSVQRLVDDLWGEAVPGSAVKMVHIHVSQLRKALPEAVLHTRPPGYAAEVEPEAVDVTRFANLREEGRAALAAGDPVKASMRLRDALALWRGPALAEFSEPFAQVEGAYLEELRLVCLEARLEADIAGGRHADVIGELEELVDRHPLREALHGRLMLALHRSGRQAAARAAYERLRRTLDEQLGIEPSAALRALQQELRTPPRPAAPPKPSGDPFVGRAEELRRLEAALDEPATVLISSRAGVGKTRLAAELTARARGRGATVLTGRCIQLVGAGLPYLPLVEALRPVTELPRLLEGAERPSRLRLFEEVLAVLEQLERPVLVLEDLHWADESTLDLVAFLAHARRLLLIVTYRIPPGPHLQSLAASLVGAGALALPLAPLARPELESLLSARSEQPLPPELVDAIAQRSEGNPFFARELLAAAARGESALPPALRDALLADVARLDARSRAVLRVAAAAGRDVSYGLLAALLPEPGLAEALRAAVEHDVLVADQAAGTFRFRHALFAEAIYETLLPGEREVLHERLARAPGVATAAEQAQHWAAAGRPVEALAASLQAAREAEAVAGLTEALHHVERVLELWDEVPGAEQLAGTALPSVVAWAAELAGLSVPREDEVDARLLVGVFAPGEALAVEALAERLEVTADAAAARLGALERDGLVERVGDGAFRTAPLAVTEARRLYPSVVVLESLAVRGSPPFDAEGLAALKRANGRLLAAIGDPAAAIAADDDFHVALTAGCGNPHLLAALKPIRRALLRYERVYMVEPAHIERSVVQHDAIIGALERHDHAEAAQRVRENLAGGLPDLTEAIS